MGRRSPTFRKEQDKLKLLNTKEAAEKTGLSAWALTQGAKSGRFSFTTSGKKRLFDASVLEEEIRNEMAEQRICKQQQSGLT